MSHQSQHKMYTFNYSIKEFMDKVSEGTIPPNIKLWNLMQNCRKRYETDSLYARIHSMEKQPSCEKDKSYQCKTGIFCVDMPKFIDCYNTVLKLNLNAFMSYTEPFYKDTDSHCTPLMFDIDINKDTDILPQTGNRTLDGYTEFFPENKDLPSLYNEGEMFSLTKHIAKCIGDNIDGILKNNNEIDYRTAYILTKPPYVSRGKLKHGIHIHFPFIKLYHDNPINNAYEILVANIYKSLDSSEFNLQSGAKFDIDLGIDKASWLLYGSGKSPDAGRYKLYKILQFEYGSRFSFREVTLEESFEDKFVKEYDEKGSHLVPLPTKNESFLPILFGRNFHFGHSYFEYKKHVKEYLKYCRELEDECRIEYEEWKDDSKYPTEINLPKDELTTLLRNLIDMIDRKYATDFKPWFSIFSCIKLLLNNDTGKELAQYFSDKTKGEKHNVIRENWYKITPFPGEQRALNIIKSYAKKSDPEKYKELSLNRSAQKFKVKSDNPRDIAIEALPLLKGKFLFTTIGKKEKGMYYLQGLLWVEIDRVSLYSGIVPILIKEDEKYESEYKDHLKCLKSLSSEDDEEDEKPKKKRVGRPKKNEEEDDCDAIIRSLKLRKRIFSNPDKFDSVLKILSGIEYLLDDEFIKRFDEVPTRILQRDGTIYDMIKGCVDTPKEGETFVLQSNRIVKSSLSECKEAIEYMDIVLGKERLDFMNWLGYCFTGLQLKKCCIVLGESGTGKTQFFNFVKAVLESKFKQFEKEGISLSCKKTSRSACDSNLIYAIEKSTLVYVPEFDPNEMLDIAIIKQLIGETGKLLNQKNKESKEYVIKSKLVICSNYAPSYQSGTDVTQKFIYYTFKHCFEKKGKDTDRMNKLEKDENFLDEFFTICIHHAGKVLRREVPEPMGDIEEAKYYTGERYEETWFKTRLVKKPTNVDDTDKYSGKDLSATIKTIFKLNVNCAYQDYRTFVYYLNGMLNDSDSAKNKIKGIFDEAQFENFLKYNCGNYVRDKNIKFIGNIYDDDEKFEYNDFSLIKRTTSNCINNYQIKCVLNYFSFHHKKEEKETSKQERINEIEKQIELLQQQLKELKEND